MLRNADLEAFAVPLANNMEAIRAVTSLHATLGKLYTRLSKKISVWRAYFMGFLSEKTLGSFFAGLTLNTI